MPPAVDHVRKELNRKWDMNISKDWHTRCACHVVNRAVIDALVPLRKSNAGFRSMLKCIRMSQDLRNAFRTAQVRLGRPSVRDIPNIDIETRWNSTFKMINEFYRLRNAFACLSNDEDIGHSIQSIKFSNDAWIS